MKNPSLLVKLKTAYEKGQLTWNEYVRLRKEALKHGVFAEKRMADRDIKTAWKNDKIVNFVFGQNIEN